VARRKVGLTRERLLEVVEYDATTGSFTWTVDRHCVAGGSSAGSIKSNGYVCVCIDGRRYYAHRLAWLYVHGRWPSGVIDHIDRNGLNNSMSNLRETTQSANLLNQKRVRKPNKQGFMGVHRNGNRYCAGLTVEGQYIHLGMFDSAEEASAAYERKKADFVERVRGKGWQQSK
jgi:hypothetical protein